MKLVEGVACQSVRWVLFPKIMEVGLHALDNELSNHVFSRMIRWHTYRQKKIHVQPILKYFGDASQISVEAGR